MSVAATCALPGWELRETHEPTFADEPGSVVVWPLAEGRLSIMVLGDGDRRGYTVSRAAFDVAALLEVRGVQALDVGPCEECDGEGVEGSPSDQSEGPCRACRINGEPTGRRKVAAFEAVLMGEPRRCETWRELERAHESLGEAVFVNVYHDDHCECGETGIIPGHEGARAAMRQLAEEWAALLGARPTHAGHSSDFRALVWRDEAEAKGRQIPASIEALAALPELATWVLAWLAGECSTCEGRKAQTRTDAGEWVPADLDRGSYGRPCEACAKTGLALGPHLPAARAHLAGAWQRATVECGECEGKGRTYWDGEDHSPPGMYPCTGCAGLGRVKPE